MGNLSSSTEADKAFVYWSIAICGLLLLVACCVCIGLEIIIRDLNRRNNRRNREEETVRSTTVSDCDDCECGYDCDCECECTDGYVHSNHEERAIGTTDIENRGSDRNGGFDTLDGGGGGARGGDDEEEGMGEKLRG